MAADGSEDSVFNPFTPEFAACPRVTYRDMHARCPVSSSALTGGPTLTRDALSTAMEEWHRRIPDYTIKPRETPRYSPGTREVQYLPLVWNAR